MDDWLINCKPKYHSILALLDPQNNKSENSDTIRENGKEFQLFKNQYEAKEKIDELINELNIVEHSDNERDVFMKNLLLALFNFQLGMISVETEELSAGENYFLKTLKVLEGVELKPECCILAISVRNQLGILWSGRNEHSKACDYLKAAAELYENYKAEEKQPPVPLNQLVGYTDALSCVFDTVDLGFGKCHVHTLYYLAQVYRHMDNPEAAAVHCHQTLKWQIKNQEVDSQDWSLNCAALSQFFICRDKFIVARYLLSCASHMVSKIEAKGEEEEEALAHTKADVTRCWAAYGLSLLASSSEKLKIENSNSYVLNSEPIENLSNSFVDVCKIDDYILIEENMDLFESQITNKIFLDLEEAKKVFLCTQAWLNDAKKYYKFNEYASDYVKIIQDMSKLYKTLASFESDYERICKMHKRRADLLEDTLKSLSPKYWLTVVRQLLFELGELYSEMMDLKSVLKEADQASNHAVKKINALIVKSMTHFQSFINTFKQSDKLPERYPDDYVRPALLAHFYIARHYSKLLMPDIQKSLENLKESKKLYDYIADYIILNPDQESCVEEELKLVHDLQQLIPGKMQRIASNCIF